MTPALLALALAAPAEPDFTPMFNGKDLAGWVNVNCAPGTFFVKDNEIVTTGRPTGYLRTARQYENFVLEMEWMHVNTKEVGNSGLFVWGDPLPAVGTGYTRGIEVQVLVNLEYKDKKTGAVTATSHGDLFSIWGAKCVPDRPHPLGWERCLPSENHAKGGGEWNHYKVVANDGVLKLTVNGKEVSGVSKCSPRKGYLALESEGAECHFRNLKIKELPSTNPKPAEVANVDAGHVSLFDGLTLTGWHTDKGAWKAEDGILRRLPNANSVLMTKTEYGPCELVFDWKLPKKVSDGVLNGVSVRVGDADIRLSPEYDAADPRFVKTGKLGVWNRTVLTYAGDTVTGKTNGADEFKRTGAKPSAIMFGPNEGLELRNLFVREVKEK